MGWMSLGYTGHVSPDLATVRQAYIEASKSEEATKKLFEQLTEVGKNDNKILVAYKGAVTTLMAKYSESFKDKKTFFKEGRELLEYAIDIEPTSVEIRCVRLSVQENTPKITGYFRDKEEDKQFILEHYTAMQDSGAKAFVQGYALTSDSFSEAEKQKF